MKLTARGASDEARQLIPVLGGQLGGSTSDYSEGISTALRGWAIAVLAAGMVCLVPTAAITHAYYAHILNGEEWSWAEMGPLLLMMTPLYVSMLGGPSLVVAGAAWILRKGVASPSTLRVVLLGGYVMTAWATFAVAVRPPDRPVRIVVATMACASLFVVLSTLWQRRRLKGTLPR